MIVSEEPDLHLLHLLHVYDFPWTNTDTFPCTEGKKKKSLLLGQSVNIYMKHIFAAHFQEVFSPRCTPSATLLYCNLFLIFGGIFLYFLRLPNPTHMPVLPDHTTATSWRE